MRRTGQSFRKRGTLATALALMALGGCSTGTPAESARNPAVYDEAADYAPAFDPANFSDPQPNPWFPLDPGTRTVFEGGGERVEVTVTGETREIAGVTAVVVTDQVFVDGALAEDTIDVVASQLGRRLKCRTRTLSLLGADGFRPGLAPLPHLEGRYGSLAAEVRALVAADPALGEPLVPGLPYLRAEAVYAARNEMVRSLDDVLSRRTRARIVDRDAALAAAPSVARLIAQELGWTDDDIAAQVADFEARCAAEEAAAV